jgi:hypothetical protein
MSDGPDIVGLQGPSITIHVNEQMLDAAVDLHKTITFMIADSLRPPTDDERALRRLARPIDTRTDRQLRALRRRARLRSARVRLASRVAGFDVDQDWDD